MQEGTRVPVSLPVGYNRICSAATFHELGEAVPGWGCGSGLGLRGQPGDGRVVDGAGLGSAVVVGEPVPGTVREGGEPGIVRRPVVGGVVFEVEGAELGIGYEVAFFG